MPNLNIAENNPVNNLERCRQMLWEVDKRVEWFFKRRFGEFLHANLWKQSSFQATSQDKIYRVDFTGYPSNQFSGCRLNGWICHPESKTKTISFILIKVEMAKDIHLHYGNTHCWVFINT